MQIQLGPLAAILGGTLSDPARAEAVISNVRALDAAGAGDLAFLWDPKYAELAAKSAAEAIVCKEPVPGHTCVLVDDPQQAMLVLLGQVQQLTRPDPEPGVHPQAFVDPTATLGADVYVGPNATVDAGAKLGKGTHVYPNAYVGRSVVTGEDCRLHPHSTVLDGCRLGDRVTVFSGGVVGKDGFGFVPRDGRHVRIPQVGAVVLDDDVEVGALSTVARGAIEDTRVRRGAKIDDHCHVAHNCDIGENVMLIGYARLGGSVTIGKDAYLLQDSAVGVGFSVGEGAVLGSGAKAKYGSVAAGERVLGDPARPHMLMKRIEGSLPKLPELRRRLASLEKRVERLLARPAPEA